MKKTLAAAVLLAFTLPALADNLPPAPLPPLPPNPTASQIQAWMAADRAAMDKRVEASKK